MAVLNVSELKAGMVLSKNLYAPNGRFILPQGTSLTPKSLITLRFWGITEASVASENDIASSGSVSCAVVPLPSKDGPFRLFDMGDPLAREIFRLCAEEAERFPSLGAFRESRRQRACVDGIVRSLPAQAGGPDEIAMGETRLAAFSAVCSRLFQVLHSPRSSISHVADVIGSDAALAARLLKLANSPLYGLPNRIESLVKATALIGLREVATLALGIFAVDSFRGIPNDVVEMESFWRHSVAVGVVARILAARVGFPTDRLFVAGLLHDVGRILLYDRRRGHMMEAFLDAEKEGLPLHEGERRVLGFDHQDVASALLREWRFPPALVDIISHHHSPGQAAEMPEAAVLHVADILANGLGYGTSGACCVPKPASDVVETAGIRCSHVEPTLIQADRQVLEVTTMILGRDV